MEIQQVGTPIVVHYSDRWHSVVVRDLIKTNKTSSNKFTIEFQDSNKPDVTLQLTYAPNVLPSNIKPTLPIQGHFFFEKGSTPLLPPAGSRILPGEFVRFDVGVVAGRGSQLKLASKAFKVTSVLTTSTNRLFYQGSKIVYTLEKKYPLSPLLSVSLVPDELPENWVKHAMTNSQFNSKMGYYVNLMTGESFYGKGETKPTAKMTIIELNADAASHVLKYLNTVGIVSILKTSMSMLKTFDDESVWLALCHHNHIKLHQKVTQCANSGDYKMFALQFSRFVIYGDLIKEHNNLNALQRLAHQLQQVPVPKNENDILHLVTTKIEPRDKNSWWGQPGIGCSGSISSDCFDHNGRNFKIGTEFWCVTDELNFCWERLLGITANSIAAVPKRPERSPHTGSLEWVEANIKTAEDRPIANSPPLFIQGALHFLIGEMRCTLPYNYVIEPNTVGTGRVVEMKDEAKKLRSEFHKSVKKHKKFHKEQSNGSGSTKQRDDEIIKSPVLLVVQIEEDNGESNNSMIGTKEHSFGQYTGETKNDVKEVVEVIVSKVSASTFMRVLSC